MAVHKPLDGVDAHRRRVLGVVDTKHELLRPAVDDVVPVVAQGDQQVRLAVYHYNTSAFAYSVDCPITRAGVIPHASASCSSHAGTRGTGCRYNTFTGSPAHGP